jgi:hypothetical protein
LEKPVASSLFGRAHGLGLAALALHHEAVQGAEIGLRGSDERVRIGGASRHRLAVLGKAVTARAADPDTLVASAKAYLGALNRLMIKRRRGKPEAMNAAE